MHRVGSLILKSEGARRLVAPLARAAFCLAGVISVAACSSTGSPRATSLNRLQSLDAVAVANRVTWGATTTQLMQIRTMGVDKYLDDQLRAVSPRPLPTEVQEQIDALTIAQKPLEQLVLDLDAQRRQNDGIQNDEEKKAAQQTYQQALNRLQREASTRFLLRALYSPNQLLEHTTWFWFNHFNVHAGKHDLRAMVGDYEDNAIRAHALGHFRDLLEATAHHPAMIRYLDNEQNAAGRINENYARELMELHTLGVDGGYSQRDVQELARILTGFGVDYSGKEPKLRKELQGQYQRKSLFEFNPARHDYGTKQFLGHTIVGTGAGELDEALTILSRHPSTAKFVSRKLAAFFVADTPSPALVERMAQTFLRTDGDIAATLRTAFASDEFANSLGQKFKDPVHYVVASVRYAYDNKVVLNTNPMINWLNRMAEPLYGKQTPDGYALTEATWASPGQMTTRFEIARAIGGGSAGLFKTEGPNPTEKPAFPQLANALYFQDIATHLHEPTRQALDAAQSPQEWGTLLLASPEMMYR